MGKFDGILICTDLDGTLLRRNKTISEENLRAIEYFKSEGGRFTFITGRMPYFVSSIYETVEPNAPFGCINGGGLYDHVAQRYVWAETLPREAIALAEYADRNIPGLGIQINTLHVLYFCRENEAMVRFRRATGMPNITCEFEDVHEPIGKILFGDTDPGKLERLAELLQSHPIADHFDFIRSEAILYEILPKGISKGTALQKLCEVLNLPIERSIAIGDYDNDIGMLRAAGIGIAVSNASAGAKAAADYVTVSNEEHAIARVIAELDSGTLRF